MPTPRPKDETKEEWMDRCVPKVIEDGTAQDGAQATAICSSMWEDATKAVGRAYSLLEVRAVSDDQRVIEGVATTPAADRLGDVIEPLGVKFKNPLPLLWQHDKKMPIGHATFGKPSKSGITFRAKIAKSDEPGTLKDRLDEAWQSVKLGLVRGVSIGFRPIEYEWIEEGKKGLRFLKSEVLELSVVTVPANQDAKIEMIKAVDAASREDDGDLSIRSLEEFLEAKPAASGNGRSTTTRAGVSVPLNPPIKATNMKQTIAEQISAFEASRQAKAARMNELMEKSAEKGETLDESGEEEYDGLKIDVQKIDGHLVRLREQDAMNKAAAVTLDKVDDAQKASEARGGLVIPNTNGRSPIISVRPNIPKGTGFTRYVMALAAARGNRFEAAHYAKMWNDSIWGGNTPEVEIALKAAVDAGTTTHATWAGPLVVYQNLQAEFVELLMPATIIGRIQGFTRVPFKVKVPRQTAGATVNWIGEGKVKPVSSLAFDTITMEFFKIAGIVVLTEELVRFSNPSAEAIVRDNLIKEITEFMDREFIDPTKAEASGVSPASITNGVTPVTATGTTAAAFRADVKSLLGSFLDSNLSTAGGTWIMTQTQALALSLMQTSLGTPEFPGITATGGTLLGFPVVASENIPSTGGSPIDGYPLIFLLANQIMLADDGGVSIDASREAALQMDSAPDSPATASTSLISLFQHNLIAIKAERFINWKKKRDEAVGFIQNAKYAE